MNRAGANSHRSQYPENFTEQRRTPLELNDKYRITNTDRLVWREVDGEVVVLDPETGAFYSGNGLATLIWNALAKETPLSEIRKEILQRCDVKAEQVEADIQEFIEELQQQGLIEPTA